MKKLLRKNLLMNQHKSPMFYLIGISSNSFSSIYNYKLLHLQLYHSLMIILAKIIVMTMLMIKDEDSHIIHIYINV